MSVPVLTFQWNGVCGTYVRCGRRRAVRFSRWFGGGGRLPRVGRTIDLEHGLAIRAMGNSWELFGPDAEVRRAARTLEGQEQAERRGLA